MSRPKPKHRRRFGISKSHPAPTVRTLLRSPGNDREQEGLVIANHGKALLVETEGTSHRCVARRRADRAVSGDRVRWEKTGSGSGVVTQILPRRSLLERPDDRQGTRPIAANLDQIVAVVAPQPEFQEPLLDRYLVTAEHAGIRPMIVLNKTDLLNSAALHAARERLAPYSALGYTVELSSTRTDHGLDALVERLRGQSSILVGQSGVGKSSLVSKLLPHTNIAVRRINQATRLGRHTTTATTLYHLRCGGDIIDSPGVRDFGLWHIPAEDIATSFVEFRQYLGRCRFRDCTHRKEPDCALRSAVKSGRIDARRLESYHAIIDEMTTEGRR